MKYNSALGEINDEKGVAMDLDLQNFPEKNLTKSEVQNQAKVGTKKARVSGPLGFEYEAQTQVIKQKHGDLEQIRHRLGLSRRKIAQLLMVDPSSWTRWTRKDEDAPPHIYRALEWYLLLQNKYPGMDSPFWLEAVARPAQTKSEARELQARLEQGVGALDQRLAQIQKRLRWTQAGFLVVVLMGLSMFLSLSCSTTTKFEANPSLTEVSPPARDLEDIAKKFAPIFIHEVGVDAGGDVFTNIDFDNDWVGDNNWANLEKFDLNPMAYYEVTSTPSHYFITYGLYHPRDYSYVCLPLLCHENDMEGVVVVVDRSTNKWIYTESIAHNYILSQKNTKDQGRPTLVVEWGGHGIYPPANHGPDRATKVFNPQIYALEPLSKLWNLQFREKNLFETTFDYSGSRFKLSGVPKAFYGRAWTRDRANPPWAWMDRGQGERGDIFFDPAIYMAAKHPETRFDLEYDRNPYVKRN